MKHLKIYEAIRLIRRQGSIRKAADLLAVSPSALNRSIQNFEDAIGVDVFERVPAGVRLTPAGELLVHVVERHLIEFEDLQRQLGALRDGHTGQLRIGLGEDISAGLPLLAVEDVERDMPGLSADIRCGDALAMLQRREIDLAIVSNPETNRSLEVLTAQNVPLVARANAAWAGPVAAVGLWDLATARLVLPPEGTGARTVLDHAFRRHALEEGPSASVAASHLRQAMSSGVRICVFPRTVFEGSGAPTDLTPLPLDLGSVQVSVLRLTGVPLSNPAQRLLRHVEARLDAAA
jgi:DNA-binding transcriptional LysR family regulator